MKNNEQEIRALVAAWAERTRAGDTAAVLDMMTDDVVFLRPGHPPIIGKRAFEAASNAPSRPNAAAPSIDATQQIHEIHVEGDMAWLWTHIRVAITPAGATESIVRSGDTLTVLHRVDGRWLIARDANLLA